MLLWIYLHQQGLKCATLPHTAVVCILRQLLQFEDLPLNVSAYSNELCLFNMLHPDWGSNRGISIFLFLCLFFIFLLRAAWINQTLIYQNKGHEPV